MNIEPTEAMRLDVLGALARHSLSNRWLLSQLAKRGHFIDECTLSRALNGARRTDSAVKIVDECRRILLLYEDLYESAVG